MYPSTFKANSLSLGWLLFAAALPVAAAEPGTGWSVEAGVLTSESSGVVRDFTFDGEESGASVGLRYAFNRYFAVEGTYSDFGDHFATDCPAPLVCIIANVDEVEVTGVSLAAIGTWPITDKVDVYGKLGVMGWDADFQRLDRDDSDNNVVYGAGIGIWFTPTWRMSVQLEKVDEFDLTTAGIGLTYQF